MPRFAWTLFFLFAACSAERGGLGGPAADDAAAEDASLAPDLGADGCVPGARDLCNGIDDDCDPTTEDGAGDPRVGRACDGPDADLCAEGTGFCRAGVFGCSDTTPDTPEICNGVDDDCDGMVDEPGSIGETTSWPDGDGDGYGDATMPFSSCSTPPGYVANGDDCRDHDPASHPGATETCNGIDDDCSGTIDDAPAACPCAVAHRGTHAYLFCDAATDWVAAETACRASGYWLVTIDDEDENAWVATTAKAIHATSWWVGLDDQTTEGTWVWVSGLRPGFPPHWFSGEPNGGRAANCAVTLGEGDDYWFDRDCNDHDPYVCEAMP